MIRKDVDIFSLQILMGHTDIKVLRPCLKKNKAGYYERSHES